MFAQLTSNTCEECGKKITIGKWMVMTDTYGNPTNDVGWYCLHCLREEGIVG